MLSFVAHGTLQLPYGTFNNDPIRTNRPRNENETVVGWVVGNFLSSVCVLNNISYRYRKTVRIRFIALVPFIVPVISKIRFALEPFAFDHVSRPELSD